MSKKAVLVIGQHRSATSVLTGCLNIFGGFLGKDYRHEADEFNKKGYFEPSWSVPLNDKILSLVGCNWHKVRVLPQGWSDKSVFNEIKAELKRYIKKDLGAMPKNQFYILKDPRISITLPLYLEVFRELGITPGMIFSMRPVDEIFKSMKNINRGGREHFTKDYVKRMSDTYLINTIQSLRGEKIVWSVTFDCLNYKPENYFRYLKETLDVPLKLSKNNIDKMHEFIDMKFRHHRKEADCKVIATYFGPRRRNKGGPASAIEFLSKVIENERNLDSGRFMHTVIVNHKLPKGAVGRKESLEYLDSIDGTPTRNGVIKVISRPWNRGVGGSYASFSWAFSKFRKEYTYWFFTEDDVVQIRGGYFQGAVEQIEKGKDIAYVCAFRHTPLELTKLRHPLHCHAACGATHVKYLEEVYKKYKKLPHSNHPMPKVNQGEIKKGVLSAFENEEGKAWYRKFELEGEVAFTNVYVKEGYKLEDIKSDQPVVWWNDKLY
jgi:hypothetical protein